jgi:SAM-dependent methyltransferase
MDGRYGARPVSASEPRSAPAPPATGRACLACGAPAEPSERLPGHGLWGCHTCGLLFAPERSAAELRALYGDEYFEAYGGEELGYAGDEGRRRYEARRRLAFVRRHARAGALLEIGCAGGYFLATARAAGFAVVGVEPGPGMAESARVRFGLDVRTAFLEDADLPAGAFDVACLWHVLEHLAAPGEALDRVRGLLRPGGMVAIEVPNAASAQARRLRAAWPHWDFGHHVAHYTPAALRALFGRAGFGVVHLDTFPVTGYYEPSRALHPVMLANYVKEALVLRAPPRLPHPSRHELVRAVARAA